MKSSVRAKVKGWGHGGKKKRPTGGEGRQKKTSQLGRSPLNAPAG